MFKRSASIADLEPAKLAPVAPLCEILPSLLLGAEADACNDDALHEHRITHVLSLTMNAAKVAEKPVLHCHVPMLDSPDEDIVAHFDACFQFLATAQAGGGRVLIHCQMGISRAPTIVIAFLMKHHHFGLADALTYVKTRRPIISPRLSFLFALEAYEQSLALERPPPPTPLLSSDPCAAAAGNGTAALPCALTEFSLTAAQRPTLRAAAAVAATGAGWGIPTCA